MNGLKNYEGRTGNTELDYKVIASGSSGNAVRIADIMIDCGIPFKRMKEDLYKVDTLLITHSHSDHIRADTLKSIRKEFPKIKVYGNPDVAYRHNVDKVICEAPFKLKRNRLITPFEGEHDVEVTGYVIQMNGLDIIYATDTCTIENPLDVKYDFVFLESNYDKHKLDALRKAYQKRNYDPAESAYRHLSTQRCREFYFVNRKSSESILIELHKSSRFY